MAQLAAVPRILALTAAIILSCAAPLVRSARDPGASVITVDIAIYGATPAGIAAALGALDMAPGASNAVPSVLLVEPTAYIGGMATAGGIGMRDHTSSQLPMMGGTEREWGMLNAKHYNVDYPVWQPDHWVGNSSFWAMLEKRGPSLQVIRNDPLAEGRAAVQVSENNIRSITLESGRTVQARYFLDASYEGDLMMQSGTSFTVGREARNTYNESFGGVTNSSIAKFPEPIDALWPNGTRLLYVQDGPDPRMRVGSSDDNVMAYSYRVCLTSNPSNQAPYTMPPGYRTEDFEIARRYVHAEMAAGKSVNTPWGNLPYYSYPPGNKFDACCGYASVGIDAPGLAVNYTLASHAERKRIADAHRYYVQGLMWFWTHDPESGVPAKMRQDLLKLGLCADEWPENDHWPPQLYVREAARLVGDRVFSQNDRIAVDTLCRNDSIAIAAWGFDIHEMQRVSVRSASTPSGFEAFNEGLTSPGQGGQVLFEVPYWVLLPKQAEVHNMLVLNCPSISHVAFSAVREEPTLWQFGRAAGIAAVLAMRSGNAAVQRVDIGALQTELYHQGSVLHWPTRKSCSDPIPTNNCTAYVVQGAGEASANGVYSRVAGLERDGMPVWRSAAGNERVARGRNDGGSVEIYRESGVWRIAVYGKDLLYDQPAAAGTIAPTSDDWVAEGSTPQPAPRSSCQQW